MFLINVTDFKVAIPKFNVNINEGLVSRPLMDFVFSW